MAPKASESARARTPGSADSRKTLNVAANAGNEGGSQQTTPRTPRLPKSASSLSVDHSKSAGRSGGATPRQTVSVEHGFSTGARFGLGHDDESRHPGQHPGPAPPKAKKRPKAAQQPEAPPKQHHHHHHQKSPEETKKKDGIEAQIDKSIPIPDNFDSFAGIAVPDITPPASKNKMGRTRSEDGKLLPEAGFVIIRNNLVDMFRKLKFKEPAKRAWTDIDINKNGKVSYSELEKALNHLKVDWKALTSKETMDEVFELHPSLATRKGKNSEMTFWDLFEAKPMVIEKEPPSYLDEDSPFMKLRAYLFERYKRGDTDRARIARRAFKAIDTNDSGGVTLGEMLEAFDRLRIPWREITRLEVIKHVFKGHPALSAKDGEFDQEDLLGVAPGDHSDSDSDFDDEEEDLEHAFKDPEEVMKFAEWAAEGLPDRWNDLGKLFHWTTKDCVSGCQDRKEISLEKFKKGCRALRYDGNAKVIFHEIMDECLTMREQANRRKFGAEEYIFMRQFKSFERKAMRMNAMLDPTQGGSPLSRLIKVLVNKADNQLRGWRLYVDVHSTGKVGHSVFASSLRHLGLQTQVKTIWKSLRKQHGDPVTFHEVAPEEARNLEDFCELLWDKCGLNLDHSWDLIDVNHQNWVNLEEWEIALDRMHFEGNSAAIFNGLGTPLSDRLMKEEFMYISKISSVFKRRLNKNTHLVHEFIQWVQGEFKNVGTFMHELGVFDSSDAAETAKIGVADLAARLTTMGYSGDSLAVAHRAARLEGGVFCTASSLQLLLTGARRVPLAPNFSPIILLTKSPSAPSHDGISPSKRPAWDNKIYDISMDNTKGSRNLGTSAHARSYFGNTGSPKMQSGAASDSEGHGRTKRFSPNEKMARQKGQSSEQRSHSVEDFRGRRATIPGERGLRYRKSIIKNRWLALEKEENPISTRPDWCFNIGNTCDQNKQKACAMKTYFADYNLKPCRDHLYAKMEDTRRKNDANMKAQNAALFKKLTLPDVALTPGERVLVAIKMGIDAQRNRIGKFLANLDADGSGELDPGELKEALTNLGFQLDDDDFDALLDYLDKDGNGEVSTREFAMALRSAGKKAAQAEQKMRQHDWRKQALVSKNEARCSYAQPFVSLDEFEETGSPKFGMSGRSASSVR